MAGRMADKEEVDRRRGLVADIMAWESGEMSQEDEITFFQWMIDDGMVWGLQGYYGRHAAHLLETGQCTSPLVPKGKK